MNDTHKSLLQKLLSFFKNDVTYNRQAAAAAMPDVEIANTRGVSIDKRQFDQIFRPIFYGEVSNRDVSKKELEARVILNTAINRLAEYKKLGKEVSFGDILTQPNQYQAYKGKQYENYISGNLDELGKQKKAEVDSVLNKLWGEVKGGNFQDITNNAFYYIHNRNDTITYDDKKKLFK